VPFVIWNNKLPGEPVNSRLLEAGACIVNKSTVYEVETPGTRIETDRLEPRDGCPRLKTTFHTLAGSLTMVERHVPGTVWLEKMPFTGPRDYGALEALVKSRTYRACYDRFARDDSMYGDRSVARPEAIHTPFQDLICKYMGAETFCIEWADNRDRLLKLCETIAEDRRKRLRLVAESAAAYAVIEGNVISGLAGGGIFEEYHVPYIQEACDILHEKGKIAAAHLDAADGKKPVMKVAHRERNAVGHDQQVRTRKVRGLRRHEPQLHRPVGKPRRLFPRPAGGLASLFPQLLGHHPGADESAVRAL
jgi:hypothetical protein